MAVTLNVYTSSFYAAIFITRRLKSTAIFEELQKHVSSIPDIVRKVKAIFLWNITKAGQLAAQWSECVQYAHCVYYTCMYVYNSCQQDVPKIYACKQCVQKRLCIHSNTSFQREGGREAKNMHNSLRTCTMFMGECCLYAHVFAQKLITLTSYSVVTAVDLKNVPGAVYSGEPKSCTSE